LIKIDGREIHRVKNTILTIKLDWLLLDLGVTVVHVIENGLGIIKILVMLIIALALLFIFSLKLFVQIFNQFNFHLLVDAF